MSTIYFGGLPIKLFIGVSPLYVSEGCPKNYLSEYVHYLFRRVVHKTIYRGKSTTYIGGLSTKIIYRSMSTIYFRGLSIKLFIGVSPLYVSEGCPQNYLSEYVHYFISDGCPQKIIYRSMSTICIGGLSTKLFIGVCPLFISEGCPQVKQISLFWKRFSYMVLRPD